MAKASDNPYPSVLVVEGTAPATPAAGDQRLFVDSADHKLKRKDSSGTVTTVEGGGATLPADALGYLSNDGAGSLSWAGALPVVNVRRYGAVGDGATDDATAINNAIAALPTTGGIVYFPAGDYAIASTINIGDGSSTALSTRQGIYLQGVAGPLMPVVSDVNANGYGAVRLKWTGAAGGTAVQVNGPLSGWGIKNIYLDASAIGTPATGLLVTSAQAGQVENLAVKIANGSVGIKTNAVAAFSGHQTNTMHNSWRNIFIAMLGGAADTRGLYIKGPASSSSANTCYDRWENVAIQMAAITNAASKAYGIELQECDNVRFRDVHFMPTAGAGSQYPLFFNYGGAVTANWPADCLIEGVDFGNGFTAAALNNGTPSGVATPNRVVCISTTNGAVSDPAVANLKWGYTASNP